MRIKSKPRKFIEPPSLTSLPIDIKKEIVEHLRPVDKAMLRASHRSMHPAVNRDIKHDGDSLIKKLYKIIQISRIYISDAMQSSHKRYNGNSKRKDSNKTTSVHVILYNHGIAISIIIHMEHIHFKLISVKHDNSGFRLVSKNTKQNIIYDTVFYSTEDFIETITTLWRFENLHIYDPKTDSRKQLSTFRDVFYAMTKYTKPYFYICSQIHETNVDFYLESILNKIQSSVITVKRTDGTLARIDKLKFVTNLYALVTPLFSKKTKYNTKYHHIIRLLMPFI